MSTRWLLVALLAACLALAGCGTASKWKIKDDASPAAKSARVAELEVGWDLLQTTLSGEAKLKWLLLLRQVTLKEPGKKIEKMLRQIQEASAKRVEELAELRRLSPDVSATPPPSAIGDAIQDSATDEGTKEMVFSDGSFNIRFVPAFHRVDELLPLLLLSQFVQRQVGHLEQLAPSPHVTD